ncbi:Uncharacterised protein [Mycobacterium tuberculosis]|nr:Uncharacterised protein [Mycobacterium tuberculosis]
MSPQTARLRHVVRPKTPRGDGNFLPHAWATAFDHVVRPKTPRGDGNLKPCCTATRNSCMSSDPKPREGTETHPTRYRWRASFIGGGNLAATGLSSDPKPREGTETFRRQFVDHEFSGGGNLAATGLSSDPKPREGTETGQRSTPALVDFGRRQPGGHGSVVRPKTPRGDGNQVSNGGGNLAATGGGGNLAATGLSSDPKPREGTETCANPFGVMRMVG